jgi:carbamoyl-phosphate synthase large subunit
MKQGEICLVINTPEDGRARRDSYLIRRTAVMQNIPYYTTIEGAQAALEAIEAQRAGPLEVKPLQDYYRALRG